VTTWSVVYERTSNGWSAYVPALPGVGVAAATRKSAERLVTEAIALHVQGLTEDGLPVPPSAGARVGRVEPAALRSR